ncbi:MAG TPA: TylF/MycF/NovP-related O-methyltransferase, partial [Anaerolineales bacterium]|nr:TylF/MycF/NovP-related O-methyltransferase [Anaerolineales bacterium]
PLLLAKLVIKRFLPPPPELPLDMTEVEKLIFSLVEPHTMTSLERVITLVRAVQYAVNLEGEFVECGVWKGGSMMAVALSLLNLGKTDRVLRLYDTFEGMSAPTEKDVRYDGTHVAELLKSSRQDAWIWARAGLDLVKQNMESTGYPANRIKYIIGKVEDTIPSDVPENICLLRLDTDWYESTKHELVHLFPRLVSGGILIIDDYGHYKGAKEAVDEYFEHSVFLHRIDYTGRLLVKC